MKGKSQWSSGNGFNLVFTLPWFRLLIPIEPVNLKFSIG